MTGKRIILATYGTLGDLHPYIAIALGLRSRGHAPIIATSAFQRPHIEAQGIAFHALRPDIAEFSPELMRRALHRWTGTYFILRHLLRPYLRETYDDLMQAVSGADLLVNHPLVLPGALVARKAGIPPISTVPAPAILFSATDPAVFSGLPLSNLVASLGPAVNRPLISLFRRALQFLLQPVAELEAELGLPAAGDFTLGALFSSDLVLGLFSPVLAKPQPDWPPQIRLTGFPFFDRAELRLPPGLQEFLDSGPAPIVFTLGSAAVLCAGDFFLESVTAARRIGRRALLLVGKDSRNAVPVPTAADIAAFDYAPYSEVFPRACAVVHHGGIGTTGQALRAGKPMLVVPFAHDQPDNAARLVRLGVARSFPFHRYTARRAAGELERLLSDSRYAAAAADIGRQVQSEDGVGSACNLIEEILARRTPRGIET
jgi:rhamnosyltransferase subunit B